MALQPLPFSSSPAAYARRPKKRSQAIAPAAIGLFNRDASSHPAQAGVQVPLVELRLDFGAAVEGRGTAHA
jgi:hypothetical protein